MREISLHFIFTCAFLLSANVSLDMKMDFKHGTEKFFKVIFEGITSMSLVKTDERLCGAVTV